MQSTIKSFSLVVTLLLLMLVSLTGIAQTNRFSISINSLTTNFNYGKLNSDLKPYKKNFTGLQVGVSYEAGISRTFSLVPELYFAWKGGKLKENNPLTINKSTLRLYTVEVPVMARLYVNHLYLNAGPYGTYTIGGRMKIDGSSLIPGKTTRIAFGNAANDFKRWDVGIQAGAGYTFHGRKSTLTLDVRYGYGLVTISRDVERYNRVLDISLVASKANKKGKAGKKG